MGSDNVERSLGSWVALSKRLIPVGVSILSLIICTRFAMNIWQRGVTIESWRKVTARVVDRRRVKIPRADGGYVDSVEIDVEYNVNGNVHEKTFGQLITDSSLEIYVNPKNPLEASLGFERGLFLGYAIFAVVSFVAVILLAALAFFPHLASKDHRYENSW